MKYLVGYKVFENIKNQVHLDLMDIYQDFFDKWGYELPDYVRQHTWYNITLHSKSGLPSFEISDSWVFGGDNPHQNCIKIRISDGRRNNIKAGVYKDFDGIIDKEFAQDLKECHERAVEYLNPVDVIVGSLGESTRDLDIIYFKEKPDFSRCGEVEIYGSNTAIYLDKLDIWLLSNSRHSNGFDSYSGNKTLNLLLMCHLQGYSDPGYFYYTGSEIIYNYNDNNPLHKWIVSEWDKVCEKLNIKSMQKIRKREKITVPEFMTHLKKNQDNYEIFKKI